MAPGFGKVVTPFFAQPGLEAMTRTSLQLQTVTGFPCVCFGPFLSWSLTACECMHARVGLPRFGERVDQCT